jgi:hypothetical protein
MAVVQGVKEKVHLPIYDSLSVEPEKQLRDAETTSILKFFVNVQGKTKLETNLQSASLLPHYNTFEARAMRVVISDLPPEFPEEPTGETEADVLRPDPANPDNEIPVQVDSSGNVVNPPTTGSDVTAEVELGLDRIMELLQKARESADGTAELDVTNKDEVTLTAAGLTGGATIDPDDVDAVGGTITLSTDELEAMLDDPFPAKNRPPNEQISPNNGAGNLISKFIYNTVTTLYVGEKIMIQMPTWFFPAGAGPYSEAAAFTTHGEPSPTATFRFAEPVFVDKQQNFRVEIEVPDTDVLKEVQKIYGPLFIWVVLDGYMVRDVQ